MKRRTVTPEIAEKIDSLKADGLSAAEIGKILNFDKNTIYRALKKTNKTTKFLRPFRPCDCGNHCWALTTKNMIAYVDPGDLPKVNKWNWTANPSHSDKKSVYVRRKEVIDGKSVDISMHRSILSAEEFVDHINHNPLDNRRENLRAVSARQSVMNTRPCGRDNMGFKGIYPNKKRWSARITVHRKPIYLGIFDTPEEAAQAYDSAAREHFGQFAYLNFPDHS